MLLPIYIVIFTMTIGSLYLSLTVSHIYLYFILLVSFFYVLRNYTYVAYLLYLNFYWSFFFYNIFFVLNAALMYEVYDTYALLIDYYLYS